jgi:methylmalonyl-CoA/ethylmalonyl-CoA epimerase
MSTDLARRIDHVAIAVRDADDAARWYRDNFGMEIVSDEVVESAFVRLVGLAPHVAHRGQSGPFEMTMIQLAQPVGPGRIGDFVSERGEGLHHICFTVDDTPGATSALGGDPSAVFVGGGGRATCFLSELRNGVVIELAEPVPQT